jgi:phosphoglycerol transferase MdoB-like AlkP superfamily enzyme
MEPRDRRPALAFAAVLPLATTLVLLPGEFTHYKRWLELGSDETALRLTVLAAILSKTLVPIAVGLGGLALCARFLSPRRLRVAAFGLSLLVLGALGLDLELQRNTGNHFGRYMPFLLDPETFVWAGRGFDIWPSVLEVLGRVGLALLPAAAVAWFAERWVERASARRGRILLATLVGSVGVLLIAPPMLARVVAAPMPLYHLTEQMPWSWTTGSDFRSGEIGLAQRDAMRIVETARHDLIVPQNLESLITEEAPDGTPDILVLVIESLRHDALSPQTMPRLWSLSEAGLRLDQHYATSNASHYGMFALLYGRSPLRYFETLDTHEPPTLPAQLRQWGYDTHHLTCSDLRWREMDRFLGSPHFDAERIRAGSLDECDRKLMTRAAALLAPGIRPPRFVLGFLMSTHFGYHFPDGETPFQPSAPDPNALALRADADPTPLRNRYRNSAHYIDSLIASLVARVDAEQTLIVVTGDHGESLFDDGTIAHSSRLSEVQTRVPLAIFGAGVTPGATRRGPTDHTDVLPTLLARLGIEPDRLDAYPGHDLATDTKSPFVALIHARASRGGPDRIALISPEARHALRLDLESGEILLLGRLHPDGRPARNRPSYTDEDADEKRDDARVVNWLEEYLETLSRQ